MARKSKHALVSVLGKRMRRRPRWLLSSTGRDSVSVFAVVAWDLYADQWVLIGWHGQAAVDGKNGVALGNNLQLPRRFHQAAENLKIHDLGHLVSIHYFNLHRSDEPNFIQNAMERFVLSLNHKLSQAKLGDFTNEINK